MLQSKSSLSSDMADDKFKNIMDEIISALEQAGYNPREQIHGYIQTGKLQYITRHNNARNKIAPLDTKQVWQYINSRSIN